MIKVLSWMMIMTKLKFIDSLRNEKWERKRWRYCQNDSYKDDDLWTQRITSQCRDALDFDEWNDDKDEARLMMLKLLKLFINVKECLNLLMKDKWSSFIKISSEENNNLSEIIDIVLQTVNQQEIFHQRMFFLLIEKIVIVNKVIHVLLQNFVKI